MARQRLLGPGGLSQHLGRAQLGSTGGIDERIGMVAAVRCADGVAGTVMVADRLDEALPFTTEELRVLETLGSRLGLVADNAALAGELAESADRVHQLADIVQSSEDAIAAIDMDGRITVWNPAAERLFGYETNEIAGRVASDMIPEPERARVRETFRAALAGAPASNVRMAWLRRDGTSVPVSITVSPIRGEDGTPAGASAIVRDETDRRRAEAAVEAGAAQLRRANEAKTRFLAAVAHELRAPLHAIVIAADLVDDPLAGPLTEGQVKDFGATIQASSRHMVRLIDDLSDLARIEAGRMEIRLASLSLDDLLGEVVRSLGGEARSRGVTLSSPDAPSPRVVSDPVRLRQILTNLVGNAIKFTERGGRVWIETDAGRSTVRVTVHDTGIGIREDDLVRAFLPFEQVSRTSRPGAGLGLAISRSLAELHGGTLSVTSRPGVGSSFTLELPRRRAPRERDEVSLTAGSAARGADRAGRVIAVVDDDSDALRLVAGVLRTVGYDVRTASSLAGARVILRTVTPDLMLLDLRLGDGNGLDLIRDIRSDPARRELPILVVSADTGSEMVASARVAGGDGFLAKPVRPRELLARVRDLAGHDRGEATAAR
jgi:PAS domain S-box-containing protein